MNIITNFFLIETLNIKKHNDNKQMYNNFINKKVLIYKKTQ